MTNKYLQYLNSKEWKMLRKKKLESINYICEKCNFEKAKEIHHLHYNSLFQEELNDLLAVCKKCHLLLEIDKIDKDKYSDDMDTQIRWFAIEYLKRDKKQQKEFLNDIFIACCEWDFLSRSIWINLFQRAINEIIPEFYDSNKIPPFQEIKCWKNVLIDKS